nr:transposase [Hyphomonas adhaerens]
MKTRGNRHYLWRAVDHEGGAGTPCNEEAD